MCDLRSELSLWRFADPRRPEQRGEEVCGENGERRIQVTEQNARTG